MTHPDTRSHTWQAERHTRAGSGPCAEARRPQACTASPTHPVTPGQSSTCSPVGAHRTQAHSGWQTRPSKHRGQQHTQAHMVTGSTHGHTWHGSPSADTCSIVHTAPPLWAPAGRSVTCKHTATWGGGLTCRVAPSYTPARAQTEVVTLTQTHRGGLMHGSHLHWHAGANTVTHGLTSASQA